MRAVLSIALVVLLGIPVMGVSAEGATPGRTLPASHLIADVPFHEQFNGIFCGVGSMAIVFDYLGPVIDQKEIADVARTTNSGTYPADVVRTGQFSFMSSATGRYFANYVPTAGFSERALGYAAFGHCSDTIWFEDLKVIVASDIPVIVLMTYYPGGTSSHWRVVIGYDDAKQLIYFCDTWGRDLLKYDESGIISWSYADFMIGWNYRGDDAKHLYCEHPYFGAIFVPWSIETKVNGNIGPGSTVTVRAEITYPCPKPFDPTQFPAKDAIARISLPDGMRLARSPESVSLGILGAGETAKASWTIACDRTLADDSSILIEANGVISGSVPDAYRWGASESTYYPGYEYSDMIGGQAVLRG